MKRRLVAASIVLALVAAACGSDSDSSEPAPATAADPAADPAAESAAEPATDPAVEPAAEPDAEPATDPAVEPAAEPDAEPTTDPAAPVTDAAGGGIDLTLERDDVDCTEDGLGSTDETPFFNAHYVVGGTLGAVCFGEEDATLITAWEDLAVITPALQLADLGVFGGFTSAEGGDEVTLAFVNALDADGTLFQMSVNLDSYDGDRNEALLTMAHEFSHVFTALPSQVDRTAEAADSCDTFYNGEACYEPDSLMWQWIQLFWADGLIDEIDPNAEASASGGEERCADNAGFFGAYAASSPEEDFAESFSAFVYQLDLDTPEQQPKMDWMAAQPGLAEFRDRAIAAGVGPLVNNFDVCGV